MNCYLCGFIFESWDESIKTDISIPVYDPGHSVPLCVKCHDLYINRPEGTEWDTMEIQKCESNNECV